MSPEKRATHRAILAALRELVGEVERAVNLGADLTDADLGWWARAVERDVGTAHDTVQQAARELIRVSS